MLIHLLVIVITAIAAPRWLAVHVLANALFPATLQAIAAGEDADSAVDEGLWQPPQTAELSTSTAIARTAPPAACRQPPPNPDSTPADVVPARTYMKCLGTTTTTRACHLQNVYYSIDSGHFLYYGPEGVTPEVFGQAHPRSDPWLRLIRSPGLWRGRHRKTQFFLDFRSGKPLPPAGAVAHFTRPLHLRAPMHTRSLGHFLRDNLLPMIDLPMRFGRDPVDFDWVRWESDLSKVDWEEESKVAEHYRGLHNGRPAVTWQEVLDQALQGQPSGVKFIRFAEIIGGQGPVDILSHVGPGGDELQLAQWAHMCDPFPFTAMREVAYRNHGLQVASVPELEPFVLFMDGKPGEKRYLANADDIIRQLQQTFPGVRMEHVMMSTLTLQEQLEYLAKATVVVSNIGSRSFRLIYLPNGATTILVGPPEYPYTVAPRMPGARRKVHQNTSPFYEIDNCWGFIGYVNMLQYHVTSEAEVDKAKPWTTVRDARNADIVLDEQKLTALLRVALQRGDCNVPYTGSGTLSAYAE